MSLSTDVIDSWVAKYQPDPSQLRQFILAGLRTPLTTKGDIIYSPETREPIRPYSNLPTAACQYWVEGLPPVCDSWNEGRCTYEDLPRPIGYNSGFCDGIGRRSWCDKYTYNGLKKGEFDPPEDEPACIANCPERCGIGKQIDNLDYFAFRAYNIEEIRGYNKADDDPKWVGRCDGLGMGRGLNGYGVETIEEMYLILPICNLYRPKIMGFGVLTPRPMPDDITNIHDGSLSDPLIPMEARLPYLFQMYNVRARAQLCAYWGADTSSDFFIDSYGSSPSEITINCDSGYCTNTDSKTEPFREPTEEWTEDLPYMLQDVWAPYGGIVCNGAKPECPCYTGKWIYCTDGNTKDGMRITADQIHELRFWASNWSSQEEYDEFYRQKPGPSQGDFGDETTADIYTFTHWEKAHDDDSTVNESRMIGQKHHLCMPVPPNEREFDPDIYITKTRTVYPTFLELKGTHAPGDVAFPTLVRELDEEFSNFIPDIFLMYPYSVRDPFTSIIPCEEINSATDGICYLDTNLEDTPHIQSIGYCIREKAIYFVNGTDISNNHPAIKYMNTYVRAQLIPSNMLDDFNASVADFLEQIEMGGIKSVQEGESLYQSGVTDEYGFFNVGPTMLYHNTVNTMYVICDYSGSQEYVYRKVHVKTRYWGGLIKQNRFYQEGQSAAAPRAFNPAAEAEGKVQFTPKEGNFGEIFPTFSFFRSSLLGNKYYYGYCINQYEVEDEDVTFWAQVGPTGYIWAELSDVNISYLFDFSIVSATMSYKGNNPEKLPCSDEDLSNIVLEPILPVEADGPTSVSRRSVPPNAVLLKSSVPMGFFNSDWSLKITYRYLKLENKKATGENERVIWPDGIDEDFSTARFSAAPYVVTKESDGFKVEGIDQGAVTIMAYFTDEEGRVQCAAATRLVLMGHQLSCRAVDIFYSYKSGTSNGFALYPQFAWWTGVSPTIKPHGITFTNTITPKCGDHECHTGTCDGPMWYPFNSCINQDFYNEQNGASSCTFPIEAGLDQVLSKGFGMWRYCTIHEYKAGVKYSPTNLLACGTQWRYYYAKYEHDDEFVGWGNIKAAVNTAEYNYRGWSMPPFGNGGREFVERYLLKDYSSYYDMSGASFVASNEYMPYVLDVPDFITDLNCFANSSVAGGLWEPFSCFPQLSTGLAGWVGESKPSGRYRFEDVIQPITHGSCMYPHPVKVINGVPIVKRFGFKKVNGQDNVSWAWPEYWEFIKRYATDNLNFASYIRPSYYFDLDKVEHRFITSEGAHFVTFTPPTKEVIADEATGEEGSPATYPSISLDGAYPRYFQLIYDEYNAENVIWKDENSTGEVEGSGEAPSIYYLTNNYEDEEDDGDDEAQITNVRWIHDYDTLFDTDASKTPSDDRKAMIGYSDTNDEVYGYYNRGIIVHISRSSLQYLPISEVLLPAPDTIYPENFISNSEDISLVPSAIFHWESLDDKIPLKVVVRGYYGVREEIEETESEAGEVTSEKTTSVYCIPAVEYGESTRSIVEVDLDRGIPIFPDVIASKDSKTGLYLDPEIEGSVTTLRSFEVELVLSRLPDRMLKSLTYFQVRLSNHSNEKMYIESLQVYGGEYIEKTEFIYTWERKYQISVGSNIGTPNIKNADGEDTRTYRRQRLDFKNTGQYFPFGSATLSDGGRTMSKMTVASMNEWHEADIGLGISKANLLSIERDEQPKLYKAAHALESYDRLTLSPVTPPGVSGFLESINVKHINISESFTLTQSKVPWELHPASSALIQGSYFYPGGHSWNWGSAKETECYAVPHHKADVYGVEWIHHKHGGPGNVWSAAYSLAGWGRLEYYEGRLQSMDEMGMIAWETPTDGLTGAINMTFFRNQTGDIPVGDDWLGSGVGGGGGGYD
jgi:hypothetical protein